MSLTIPRLAEAERASVLLPTVTCSSCSAPIPLSSLGDHICIPPGRATGSRAVPRPSQLSIPSSRPTARSPLAGSSPLGRSEPSSSTSASGSRPFAGPSSVSSGSGSNSGRSPLTLDLPARNSPARAPSPLSAGGTQYLANPNATASSSRTSPSPTNPFFPHHAQGEGTVHGLGLGVGGSSRREGPYPTDRPLPAGISGPGLQDGAAGMAGVGRRAFAAAAWGVRAGVAMANVGAQRISPTEQSFTPPPPPPQQQYSSSPTHTHTPLEPPSRPTEPRARSPHGSVTMPVPKVTGEAQRPRAPLANRPSYSRNASISSTMSSHERSASAMSSRSVTAPIPNVHRRAESASSDGSRHSKDDSISQLLKARAGESSSTEKKPAFFEKYKQFVAVADGRNSPILSMDKEKLVSSPEHATLRIEDESDDDGESALPWAKPTPNASPAIPQQNTARPTIQPRSHSRQHTLDSSSGHSSSSSRSGVNGGSGAESEEIVTPSQSWEGSLVDRVGGLVKSGDSRLNDRDRDRDALEQIEEEEEGDRVVFNTSSSHQQSVSQSYPYQTQRNREKTSAIPIRPPPGPVPHVRSHTAPESRPSQGRSNGSKRTKQCQNCLEVVGGSKRFVERDGIVLCEKDWKLLYLPSCRRCQLPIEKSAVSSSDGQLKGKWHKECFSCTKCSKPFEGDSFYVLQGKPWCQYHYHEENGTLCASSTCRQPIEGPCLLTQDRRYHPGHLHCDKLGCRERMDEYYEVGDRRYCESHVKSALAGPGLGVGARRAEKRITRLVELPAGGGFGF